MLSESWKTCTCLFAQNDFVWMLHNSCIHTVWCLLYRNIVPRVLSDFTSKFEFIPNLPKQYNYLFDYLFDSLQLSITQELYWIILHNQYIFPWPVQHMFFLPPVTPAQQLLQIRPENSRRQRELFLYLRWLVVVGELGPRWAYGLWDNMDITWYYMILLYSYIYIYVFMGVKY